MTHLTATLYGTTSCRRYQRMKKALLEAAEKTQTAITINEVEEIEALEKFNPLSLPRLYIGNELIASQNPPKSDAVSRVIENLMKHG
ncbi:MAG: hypothetical protein Kow002_06950 [Anaerolineales bacterium]